MNFRKWLDGVAWTYTHHIVEAQRPDGEWVVFGEGIGEDEREWVLDRLHYLEAQGIPCRYIKKSPKEIARDNELRARERLIKDWGLK